VGDQHNRLMTFARDGDSTIVKIAPDERYAIPDAFIRGG